MRKTFCATLFTFCMAASAVAQTTDRSVVASAAGSGKASNISLEWTMGENAVETIFSGNKMYTQGFNQPFLIVTSPGNLITNSPYTISIAPNPIISILNVSISSRNINPVFLRVTDIQGKILVERKANSALNHLQIDFKTLPAGTYTLTVTEAASAHMIKTYQVIKL